MLRSSLVQQIRNVPSVVVDDPAFIRIKYVRYADDWLIGIAGPRRLAELVKEELATFLSHHLKLTLSPEKTKITHAHDEQAHFLGTDLTIGRGGVPRVVTTRNGTARPIRRRSTGSEMVMTAPLARLVQKLPVPHPIYPEILPGPDTGGQIQVLPPSDFPTVRHHPHHPDQRWETGTSDRILSQQRLEKTTQWLP